MTGQNGPNDPVRVKLDEHIFVNGELCEAGEVIECPRHFARELHGTRKGHVITDAEIEAPAPQTGKAQGKKGK